jgi:hypothetical protein
MRKLYAVVTAVVWTLIVGLTPTSVSADCVGPGCVDWCAVHATNHMH